jgi:hypothetical protein
MAIQNLNTLKNWFKRGFKPLQQQFYDWMDSFWHKDEMIPMNKVDQLESTLNTLSSTKVPLGPDGKVPIELMPPGIGPVEIIYIGDQPVDTLQKNTIQVSGSGDVFLVDKDGDVQQLEFAATFKQGGNSFETVAELGTLDENALLFKTNATERIRLTSNGNVGIGTTTPTSWTKLDVAGDVRTEGSMSVDRAGGDLTSYFYAYARGINSDSNFGNPFGNGAVEIGEFGTPGLILGSRHAGKIAFGIKDSTAGQIFDTGNWHIGAMATADPGFKLNVAGTLKTTSHLLAGSFAITKGVDVYNLGVSQGIRIDDVTYSSMRFQTSNQGWVADNFVFENTFGANRDIFSDASIIRIKQGWGNPNQNIYNLAAIRIDNEINNTVAGSSYVVRGIYYNPTVTSLGSATSSHIAFENTSGNMVLNSVSGNTLIGTTIDSGYKLDVNGKARVNDTFTVVTPTSPFVPGGMKVETDNWQRPGATRVTVGTGSWFSGFDNQFHFCGYNGNGLTIQSGGAATQKGFYIAPSTMHSGANDSYLKFGISDASEFLQGPGYPSEQNFYELLTHLNSPQLANNTGSTAVRAPLRISSREILFYTGDVHNYNQAALAIGKTGNILIGTSVDAGYKLDINGNTRINGSLTMATDSNSLGYITNNSIYGGFFNFDFTANTAGAGGGIRLRHAGNIYAQILTASPTNPYAPTGLLLDVPAGHLDSAVRTAGKLFRWGKTNTMNGSGAQMTFDPFNVRLIIGTEADNGATLQVNGTTTASNDIEINQSGKGLILKSPNGTRYRFTVADNGALITSNADAITYP